MWTTAETLSLIMLPVMVILVARWRFRGMLAASIIGYLGIYGIYVLFAGDTWHDREALAEWPRLGLVLMPAWSLGIYGLIRLWSWLSGEFKASRDVSS